MEGRGENKKGRREKKREVEAEEKEGLQHKLIDMQSGCSSIRVHTLAKASSRGCLAEAIGHCDRKLSNIFQKTIFHFSLQRDCCMILIRNDSHYGVATDKKSFYL